MNRSVAAWGPVSAILPQKNIYSYLRAKHLTWILNTASGLRCGGPINADKHFLMDFHSGSVDLHIICEWHA